MALGLFLLIMPLMVSTVIRVFGWVVILGSEGLVNQALRVLGAGDGVRLLDTEAAVIIGLAQQSMPFMVLPIMAAIERIPPSLEEAAQNLGRELGADVRAHDPAAQHARARLRRACSCAACR